ncbi:hypothetical protein HF521_002613 [Silurus meridionalis]|uniref:Zinc ribbon domain containing 2 n=1 Tax=Silurus meridionalis TaxID=175797 RepID=A0A8T0B4X5_SILME|nr:hypothetical protein HF521_002613 [Silurus meridionalis]
MALNADEEDFNWEPPSEAEMKVFQARRERQDKISKLMGDYLLKGYKMLGDCCDICGTILLQDKQKKNYCVACQELDSDIDKDNPALNAQAALSQVRERQLANHPLDADEATPTVPEAPPSSRPEHCEGAASGLKALPPPRPPSQPLPLPVPSPTAEPQRSPQHSSSSSSSSSPSSSSSSAGCSGGTGRGAAEAVLGHTGAPHCRLSRVLRAAVRPHPRLCRHTAEPQTPAALTLYTHTHTHTHTHLLTHMAVCCNTPQEVTLQINCFSSE